MDDLFTSECPSFDGSRQTILSPDRVYRYTLWRTWSHGSGYVMFIGLNPSTADETTNDPTIRRCIDFAKRWGYSALCMANLFAYRATQPPDMMRYPEPIGPENDRHLRQLGGGAGLIVAAWGNHGEHLRRDVEVRKMFAGRLHCFRLTKKGQPEHPLYMPATFVPVRYDFAF